MKDKAHLPLLTHSVTIRGMEGRHITVLPALDWGKRLCIKPILVRAARGAFTWSSAMARGKKNNDIFMNLQGHDKKEDGIPAYREQKAESLPSLSLRPQHTPT